MKLPTIEQTRLAAYRRWERRGGGDGHDLFDYHEARNDLIMALNYKQIAHFQLDGCAKVELGSKGLPCRYCGKSKPAVTFEMVAHALPEFIGNKSIIDLNECDECNRLFSRNMESNLSGFLLPLRTNLGMVGKKGVPTYVSKSSRIESDGTNLNIKQFASDPVAVIDESGNKLTMPSMKLPSYVPIGVYKCLTKMALAIMPAAEFSSFNRTREWLQTDDPNDQVGCFAGHIAYVTFVPGPRPFEFPWAVLSQRLDDAALLPHMIFTIGTANLVFQILVPLSDKDDFLYGQRFTFPRFGLPSGPGSEFGVSTVGRMPLSSAQPVRGSTVTVEHHVGSFNRVH